MPTLGVTTLTQAYGKDNEGCDKKHIAPFHKPAQDCQETDTVQDPQ